MENTQKPNFEEHLMKGSSSYDSPVGAWWVNRAIDADHQEAYKNIAELFFARIKLDGKQPHFVIDYACGAGHLFPHLQRLLPDTIFIGMDGSLELLNQIAAHNADIEMVSPKQAFDTEGKSIRLVHTALPNFQDFPFHLADALILCFPNLLPDISLLNVFNQHGYTDEKDTKIARSLARFQEMDPEHREEENPDQLFDEMMTQRVFARNFHHLLKPDALMLKVEYSNCHRNELTDLTLYRTGLAEASLEHIINGDESDILFHYRETHYTESAVILDVYHQTQDLGDTEGGYCVHFYNRESNVSD